MERIEIEVNVFVVWPWAKKQRKINRFIKKNFVIIDKFEANTSLASFYGTGPTDPVTAQVFVVRTSRSREVRPTSTGNRSVNPTMFDTKQTLRKWGGKSGRLNSVHGSDDQEEAIGNLVALAPDHGSGEELFGKIPGRWVVLRNFQGELDHSDIDIMVEDVDATVEALQAIRLDAYGVVDNLEQRGVKNKYLVKANGQGAILDLRYVGDGYFDERWQRCVLHDRINRGGVYTPSDHHWYWTLLYHALIHKGTLGKYQDVLEQLRPGDFHNLESLVHYMRFSGLEFVRPDDPLVVMFGVVVGEVTSGFGAASTIPQKGMKEVWQQACGYEPYPGTLNIKYEGTFQMRKPDAAAQMYQMNPETEEPEPIPVYFWHAKIKDQDVVLSVGGNRPDEVEVLAPVNLRETLELEDGDKVVVIVNEA